MSFHSLTDVQKSKQGIDHGALTVDQKRRLLLKQHKETLLALADPKLVSDDDLRRLMQTGFGKSIGPFTRAIFPPQVTGVLQPHSMHVPREYRLDLTTVAVRDLPTPPHDWRDHQARCGNCTMTHSYEGPRIEQGKFSSRLQSCNSHFSRPSRLRQALAAGSRSVFRGCFREEQGRLAARVSRIQQRQRHRVLGANNASRCR